MNGKVESFMFMENRFIMEYIEKRNGYVYLVKEHDSYGRHKSITNLGKDPDSEMWKEEIEKPKEKKGRIKKDEA